MGGYICVARSFGEWPPVTDRLGEIDIPTLICWGEEDAPFLKPSQIMNESISDYQVRNEPKERT
jgi:pimeloyl-ACP methyl ester carboxylesterase